MKKTTETLSLFNESGIEIPVSTPFAGIISEQVFGGEKKALSSLEIVFTHEDGIVEINKEHLNRDYVTDIITFHYQEENQPVEATIFCCAQRIKEQAKEFNVDEKQEFCRILIHGMLHLCGYEDTSVEQKTLMTEKENEYLKRIDY